MGRRGKERAKQAKAAREIKYHSVATDFNQLERELGGSSRHEEGADPEQFEPEDDSTSAAEDPERSSRVSP